MKRQFTKNTPMAIHRIHSPKKVLISAWEATPVMLAMTTIEYASILVTTDIRDAFKWNTDAQRKEFLKNNPRIQAEFIAATYNVYINFDDAEHASHASHVLRSINKTDELAPY